ncbi:hypothetical protein [Streptomyces minutiscleroticus]|uniref:hypothetical protein n=1 Tax=Streptomyces minutiscleroticus TaxID=68238 RepID=UPI00331C639A
MLLSTTTPAAENPAALATSTTAGAGSLALTAGISAVMAVLATYTLLHHKQVFAWTKAMRRRDDDTATLAGPAQWISKLYEEQCGLAQKPCHTAEFKELARVTNMIKGIADHTAALRTELNHIVEQADDYLATALPDPGPATKISTSEHRHQLVRAMRQEAARTELERALITAEQKINTLRRG